MDPKLFRLSRGRPSFHVQHVDEEKVQYGFPRESSDFAEMMLHRAVTFSSDLGHTNGLPSLYFFLLRTVVLSK